MDTHVLSIRPKPLAEGEDTSLCWAGLELGSCERTTQSAGAVHGAESQSMTHGEMSYRETESLLNERMMGSSFSTH